MEVSWSFVLRAVRGWSGDLLIVDRENLLPRVTSDSTKRPRADESLKLFDRPRLDRGETPAEQDEIAEVETKHPSKQKRENILEHERQLHVSTPRSTSINIVRPKRRNIPCSVKHLVDVVRQTRTSTDSPSEPHIERFLE